MAEEKKEAKETKETKDPKEIANTKEIASTKEVKEVKDDKGMPEWLAPILSALGGMGGSYMLFIKPLQERMDALTNQIHDLRAEVKELKHQNRDLEKELGAIQEGQNVNIQDYLPVKKSNAPGSYVKRRL
jgi:hypothetical protein